MTKYILSTHFGREQEDAKSRDETIPLGPSSHFKAASLTHLIKNRPPKVDSSVPSISSRKAKDCASGRLLWHMGSAIGRRFCPSINGS